MAQHSAPVRGGTAIALTIAAVVPLLAAAAPENEALEAALKNTRAVVEKHHLISLVDIDPLGDGKTTNFRYDRYPEVERVQMKDGVYARRKPKGWMKSNDWTKTGTKVKSQKAAELDALVSFVDAPLNNISVSKDTSQGDTVVRVLRREPKESGERIFYELGRENATAMMYPQFIFDKGKADEDSEALLVGFAGLMYSGDEKVKVNINYSYMFLVDLKPAKPDGSPASKR